MNVTHSRKRRWYQFGLPSLAVLCMLAGLLFSGIRKYLDRIQDKENIDAIVTQIEDWGGEVGYDIPTPRNWAENIALWCETVAMGKEFTAQPVAVEISAYAVKDDRWLWGALIDGRVGGR